MTMAEQDDLRPWDRQPSEGSKAYEHFQTYLDMGSDRTLQGVADMASKSEQYIRSLSTKHGWKVRSAAWDSMPRRAVVEAHAEMAARISAQHEDLATALMAKLRRNVEILPEGADPSIKLSTALGAARQSHQFATELVKPESTAKEEITKAIENLVAKLAGE